MGKMKELGLLDCEDRQSIEENFERMKKSSGGDLLETVETEVPLVITWDGDIANHEFLLMAGNDYLVKVSDIVLSNEQIVGSTIIITDGTTETESVVTPDDIMDVSSQGMPCFIVNAAYFTNAVYCMQSDFSNEGMAISAGVWVLLTSPNSEPAGVWVKSLTCPNATTTTTKQQLKPSLLPNHNHKWDDIEDAICGEINEYLINVENGEFANMDGMLIYMLSESLGVENGKTYTIVWDGAEYNCTATVINEEGNYGEILGNMVMMNGSDTGEPFLYLCAKGMVGVFDMDAAKAGITESTYHTFSIGTKKIKKIDNKFIDAEWMAKENEITEIIFDGNTEGLVTYNGSPKISDLTPTPEQLAGGSLSWILEGVKRSGAYVIDDQFYGSEYQGTRQIRLELNELSLVTIVYEGSPEGVEPGIYVVAINGNYVSSITFGQPVSEGATPLPEKFMPELTQLIIKSSTEGSEKKFRVTVDDTGALTAVEV